MDEGIRWVQIPIYHLEDDKDEPIMVYFYPEEIQKVNPRQDRVYRTKKVTAEKRKEKKKSVTSKMIRVIG